MKVLMINSVCGRGSTGRICTDIADMLMSQGNECKIAYGRNTVPEKYKDISYKTGSDFGVKLNGLKARLFDNEGFNARSATKKLIRFIKEDNPDVIHLHNLHGYYLNVKILFDYLKTCGKKVIWTLHDCWAFTGHCSHFTLVKCEQWQTRCSYCPQKEFYPKAYFSHAKRNFNLKKKAFCGVPNLTIVTPSKWLADLVKQSFLKEYPVKVINNGIDATVFKPTESDFKERYCLTDKKIILGVANVWEKRKGFDDFLQLAKLIDDNYRIVLVGVNDKQLKTLPRNVIGIKRTNSAEELAQIYTASDVFINPSKEETFGMTPIEAMACGTFAIVYNATALSELSSFGAVVCENNSVNDILLELSKLKIKKDFDIILPTKEEKYLDYIRLYE